MTKYRLVATEPVQTAFVDGDFLPGNVYNLPDTQPDGTEINWPAEFWVNVDSPPTPAPVASTPENESSQ